MISLCTDRGLKENKYLNRAKNFCTSLPACLFDGHFPKISVAPAFW